MSSGTGPGTDPQTGARRGSGARPDAGSPAEGSTVEGSTNWLAEYAGLTVEEAVRRAGAEGRPVRVLHPGDLVTLDHRPDRLNICLTEDGEIDQLRAG